MGAVRQDSWRDEDDQRLAEVILRHIRDGATQLLAFQEASNQLGRTPAACGFRWNSVVRKQYESSIQSAKAERKKRSGKTNLDVLVSVPAPVISAKATRSVIESVGASSGQFLEQVKAWSGRYVELESENDRLKMECHELKEQMQALQDRYHQMNEDYQSIVQIMERARRMTLFSDEAQTPKRRFRMDVNGNLEQYM